MKCPVAMRRVVLCTGVALGSACSFGTTQARPEAVVPRSCFGASAQETEFACIVDGQPVICSELFGSSIVNQCSMPYDPRGMVTVAGATPVTRRCDSGTVPHIATIQTTFGRSTRTFLLVAYLPDVLSGSRPRPAWPDLTSAACELREPSSPDTWEAYSVSFGSGDQCYHVERRGYLPAPDPTLRIVGDAFVETE